MSPFRAVIFDLGNVLIRLRPVSFHARRPEGGPPALQPGVDPLAALRGDPALERFERGRITEGEFFAAIGERLGGAAGEEEIRAAYLSILGEPMPEMAELIAELHRSDVRTIGLSDISPGHLALVGRYPAVRALERVVASCETGHRKPEPGAYRAALDFLKTRPEETIFIDDREENVAGATALGLKGILFTNPESLKCELNFR